MKCVIPNQNVKVVARAVHSLAKIGDEMYIESNEDELIFKTVNTTKSAFGEFRMCRSFFSSYNYSAIPVADSSCKVTMKSCIGVFKNSHGMDKQVENCEIRFKPENTQIIFQIKFINSSVKKYYLPIIENDQLEAQIPAEAPNQLCASSKFLAAALRNFRPTEDEITLAVSPDKTTLKNHLELRRDANLMRTELSYHKTEFENYVVRNPTTVTFCLKELRAVIMFAEPGDLPVLMSFTEPGSPVVFQVQNHPAYEANYVVSTLQPSSFNKSSSSRMSSTRIESPQVQVRNQTNVNPNSSTYSFREDSVPEQFPLTKPQTPKTPPVAEPQLVLQQKLQKSIRFHFDIPNTQDTDNESMPQPMEMRKSAEIPDHMSPLPSTSRQADYPSPIVRENLNATTVIPESETSQASIHSRGLPECPLQEETLSQPSPELLKVVFARCFSKDHFLSSLVGHDVILEESSDQEVA